jgi:hypothetical protein
MDRSLEELRKIMNYLSQDSLMIHAGRFPRKFDCSSYAITSDITYTDNNKI